MKDETTKQVTAKTHRRLKLTAADVIKLLLADGRLEDKEMTSHIGKKGVKFIHYVSFVVDVDGEERAFMLDDGELIIELLTTKVTGDEVPDYG
jgi:hypothetical protein